MTSLSPREAIQKGWIQNFNEEQIHSTHIDVTLDKVYGVKDRPCFIGSNDMVLRDPNPSPEQTSIHKIRRAKNVHYLDITEVEAWELGGRTIYKGESEIYIDIPADILIYPIFPSEKLIMNGIAIKSHFITGEFKGNVSFIVENQFVAKAYLEPHIIIGKLIFASA